MQRYINIILIIPTICIEILGKFSEDFVLIIYTENVYVHMCVYVK